MERILEQILEELKGIRQAAEQQVEFMESWQCQKDKNKDQAKKDMETFMNMVMQNPLVQSNPQAIEMIKHAMKGVM